MKYYITRKGQRASETSKEHFYSLRRNKKNRERSWIKNDEIVARELIIE